MFYQELKHSRAMHSPPRLLTITQDKQMSKILE